MKKIYIQAFIFWAFYSFSTKYLLVSGTLTSKSLLIVSLYNSLAGIFFAVVFLYLFSNDNFFPFVKRIESKEIKKEKKWEKRLFHFGKVFSVFLIAILSGPMLSALAAKFLLNKFKSKYLLVGFFGGLSSFLWVLIARGIVHLPF